MKVKPLHYIVKQKFLDSFLEKINNQWENYQTLCFRIAVSQYHPPGQKQQVCSVAERMLQIMHSGKTNHFALCSPNYQKKTKQGSMIWTTSPEIKKCVVIGAKQCFLLLCFCARNCSMHCGILHLLAR